jgi:hypothetical protein
MRHMGLISVKPFKRPPVIGLRASCGVDRISSNSFIFGFSLIIYLLGFKF